MLTINRLKNSSDFSRAMLFFTKFLSFRGFILQVLQHMQVLNVLNQLSCSGALQIYEMQMAIQKNVEICLHPYFQLIAGPVTFHASYPMWTVKGVLPKHQLPFLLPLQMCVWTCSDFLFVYFVSWMAEQSLLTVIAVYGYL